MLAGAAKEMRIREGDELRSSLCDACDSRCACDGPSRYREPRSDPPASLYAQAAIPVEQCCNQLAARPGGLPQGPARPACNETGDHRAAARAGRPQAQAAQGHPGCPRGAAAGGRRPRAAGATARGRAPGAARHGGTRAAARARPSARSAAHAALRHGDRIRVDAKRGRPDTDGGGAGGDEQGRDPAADDTTLRSGAAARAARALLADAAAERRAVGPGGGERDVRSRRGLEPRGEPVGARSAAHAARLLVGTGCGT